jgi:hypothetical protein
VRWRFFNPRWDKYDPSSTTFTDEKAFESYVAGYLGVQSVDCKKLEATKATCTTDEGREVIVLCLSADAEGGNDCTITYKSE